MQANSSLSQSTSAASYAPSAPVPSRRDRLATSFSLGAPSLQTLVLLILGVHLLLWVGLPGVFHSGPDADNMEELIWGNTFEWGYFKHPPLPSWVHFTLFSVFGRHVWVTFLAGQLSVTLAFYFIWRLGCEMTSQRNALLGVLMMMPIAYFTVRGVMSNHNTLQLWSVAGAIWMLYRAVRHQQLRDWMLLGMFSGFGVLTKYSMPVWFLVFILYLIQSGSLRDARTWKGMLAGTCLMSLIVLPHALWLYHVKYVLHDPANPINYALGSARMATTTRAGNLLCIWYVLTTTLARVAPMLLGMLVVGGLMRRARRKDGAPVQAAGSIASHLRPQDRSFILILSLAPFILTCAASILIDTWIIADWTTTFFVTAGLLTFWAFPESGDDNRRLLKTALVVIGTIQILTAAGYAVGRGPLASLLGKPSRSNFPSAAVAQVLKHEWYSHAHAPLRFIVAHTWLGGNIAIHAGRDAEVLINGNPEDSPWVNLQQLKACGALVAIDASPFTSDPVMPEVAQAMKEARWTGTVSLPATLNPHGPQVVVQWGVIPPAGGCIHISHDHHW